MFKKQPLSIILLIPHQRNKWLHMENCDLKRIVQEVFYLKDDDNFFINVHDTPPKNHTYNNGNAFIITAAIDGCDSSFFRFAKNNINNPRVFIYVQGKQSDKAFIKKASSNSRIKDLCSEGPNVDCIREALTTLKRIDSTGQCD